MNRSRNNQGNMLVLVSIFMAVNAILILIACSFGGLFFVHNRLQTTADEVALAGARKLNELDRIGQMNNMVARSRQLVYASRENLDRVSTDYPSLQYLAQELYDDAKESAQRLENIDRKHLLTTSENEARQVMLDKFNEVKDSYAMSLPWLRVGTPTMSSPLVGKIRNVKSNVRAIPINATVLSNDLSVHNLESATGLYKDGINARLPGADASLDFKIASLAAPVQKTISPARVSLAKSFEEITNDQLRSAVQVKLTVHVATGLGPEGQSDLSVTGTAASNGGADQQ
jgi:hypothetical protein